MELAWHTQKNQMSDVKGKEKEQEREGEIKNEDIDLNRTKFNYDLVESELNLYQRVKERVTFAKENKSRVQKNSVVMYSNILTVPEDTAKKWGDEKTARYFEACYEYFGNEFGKENVVGAKVHLDETTPHMHLHFVPFNKENGKLQARVAMDKAKINHIHDTLPAFLQEKGFEVVRGSGKTKGKNIEDVHEYKKVRRAVADEQAKLSSVKAERDQLQVDRDEKAQANQEMIDLYNKNKAIIDENLSILEGKVKTAQDTLTSVNNDISEKKSQLNALSNDLTTIIAQIEQSKKLNEEEEKALELQKEKKIAFINDLEHFKGDLQASKEKVERKYENELNRLRSAFKDEKELLLNEKDRLTKEIAEKEKKNSDADKKLNALEVKVAALKSETKRYSKLAEDEKAAYVKYNNYINNDLKLFSEEFLNRDKPEDYSKNLDLIENRLEPFKKTFGKTDEDRVVILKDDLQKLFDYTYNVIDFRDTLYSVESRNKQLEKSNSNLLSQIDSVLDELDESKEREHKISKQYTNEVRDTSLLQEKHRNVIDSHNHFKNQSVLKDRFIDEMGLNEKFYHWQEKREQQEKEQNKKNNPTIKRKSKQKDAGLEL